MKNIIFPPSSGGGTASTYTEVTNYAALPVASTVTNKIYVVLSTTGIIYINRKLAGMYRSNGTTWDYLGDVSSYVSTSGGTTGQALVKNSNADYDTKWQSLAPVATSGAYSDLSGTPTNVTTQGNTFNGASQLVKLDAGAKLPAVDGSLLTNLPSNSSVQYISQNLYFPENCISNRSINTAYSFGMFIEVKAKITTDALVIQCTTSGTASGTIAIYKMNGVVGTKLSETGTISLSSVAYITGTITPIILQAGLYYITCYLNGTGSVAATSSSYGIPLSRYFGSLYSITQGGFLIPSASGHPATINIATLEQNSSCYASGIRIQ